MKKGKSRKSSKSPSEEPRGKSKNNKQKYYNFNQKSVMLTYPHTDNPQITKIELGEYLRDHLKADRVVVCQEFHKDGSPHLHAWIEWDERFNSNDPRVFDFKGKHPNIGHMNDKNKNTRGNALTYMMKTDNDLWSHGIDLKNWKYTSNNHKKYIAQDLIDEKITLPEIVKVNPSMLFDYNKIKSNLNSYKIDTDEKIPIIRIPNNLWVFGPPGIGKSYYVNNAFPGAYYKQPNKWWDGYTTQDTVIMDDFDSKSAEISHYLKTWTDNYIFSGEIKGGFVKLIYIRFVITSNYLPKNLFSSDSKLIEAIDRRFTFVTVTGQFPNFTTIPIDINSI